MIFDILIDICYHDEKGVKKMNRSIINKDTFEKIFCNQEELLARMASSLTRLDYDIFNNNITCNLDNLKKVDYIISMPDDDIIKIINVKTNEKIIINLKIEK